VVVCLGGARSGGNRMAARRATLQGRQQPPGRGGRDRRSAGRSARDGVAARSAAGGVADASQLRCMARSAGGGGRGARGDIRAQAVLAEGGELDDQVERRAELLSEPGEHAFERLRTGSDGRLGFVQLPLQRAERGSSKTALRWPG
jgi:hypothetical protein